MNAKTLDLALRKQRLQLQSAAQREAIVTAAAGLAPVFGVMDGVRAGVAWLRRNPAWLVGGIVVIAVARPRAMFRWAGRAWLGVRLWQRLSEWQDLRPRFR